MSVQEPLVSVVIPTYNRSWGLITAINSVLSQTYANFELVVVDDCSVDDTYEVVQRYQDHRIKYYRNEVRLGMVGNWGKGLNLAKGLYFNFLMDDDQLRPNFLLNRMQILTSDPSIAVVFSNYDKIDKAGNVLGSNRNESHRINMDSDELLKAAISRMWFVGASVYQTTMVRNHWDAVITDDLVLDFSLNIQLALKKNIKGVYIPDTDFILMEHPEQNSVAKLGRVLEQTEKLLERMYLYPNIQRNEKKLIKQELANWRVMWGRRILKQGDRGEAQKKYWRAIRSYPTFVYAWKMLIISFV